jgi:DNA-binding transcriptional MerR regulator
MGVRANTLLVLVGELAKRVGRSPDTIKRWVDAGLLECHRDDRNRRQFGEAEVSRCVELVRLGIAAQIHNRKLEDLAKGLPQQLTLMARSEVER